MATAKTGPPNFLVPNWLTQPIADPATLRSGITPNAIHKIFPLSRGWKLDLDLEWTVTGDFSAHAEAHLGDEVFEGLGGSPIDEIAVQTDNWIGYGFGDIIGSSNDMTGHFVFDDGAVSPDFTLTVGQFGIEFSWIAMNPGRTNLWSDEELELRGYISAVSPGDIYYLLDGESTPLGEVPFGQAQTVSIAWETGEPGQPFFGTVGISNSLPMSYGGSTYTQTLTGTITITPTSYWGNDGTINTSTGDEI